MKQLFWGVLLLLVLVGGCSKVSTEEPGGTDELVEVPQVTLPLSDCEKIGDRLTRADCYIRVAKNQNDSTLCERIPEEGYLGRRDDCYYEVGVVKTDFSVCEKIVSESLQRQCVNTVSSITGEPVEEFPEQYIFLSQNYIDSKFGQAFSKDIKFSGTSIELDAMASSDWNEKLSPSESYGKKYVVEYVFDQRPYITPPPKGINPDYDKSPLYDIRIVWDENGNLYASNNVVDCINHPEYCPPYEISTYTEAVNAYNKKCSRQFSNVRFKIYSKLTGLTNIKPSEARFMWYFYRGALYTFNWGVYLDPQTGKIYDFDLNEVSEC